MFQGNNVRDECWQAALFQDLGSSPATMQAGKACDALGLAPGYDVQQADAEQAYVQSRLGGDTPTWVRLPKDRQPPGWKKYRDPVCPLVLALYGHPDSGGYWEKHCHDHLTSVGFQLIPEWRSCYLHTRLNLFLVVYVDDFKLAGPAKNLKEGWALIRRKVNTEEPTPLGKYLGCQHVTVEHTLSMAMSIEQGRFMWPPLPNAKASCRGARASPVPGSPRGGF